MLHNLKIFCTLFFALFLTSAYSQNNIFFHIGPAFPLADFGDDDDKNDNARGAKLGIDCGLKYIYKVNDVGLGLFGQVDFIYNSLTNRFKDEIDDYFLRNYDNVDFKHFKYINIPLFAGINYSYPVKSNINLFGEIGIGINFSKITNLKVTFDFQGDNVEQLAEFSSSSKLAYKLGGGIEFKNKLYFSINYEGLGKHGPKIEEFLNGQFYDSDYLDKFLISMLTLNIGIKLL